MEEVKGLKIKGKQGPFGVQKLGLRDILEMGEDAAKGGKSLEKQYTEICQKSLCYMKSEKQVYSPQQRPKMDKDLGGGWIIEIAQQAMKYNRLMKDDDLNQKVEDAEKN